MVNVMKKYLSTFLLIFLQCSCLFAQANEDDGEELFRPSGIKNVHNNQNALKLLNDIPPELRNLPYATYPTSFRYNTFRFNFNKRFNVFPKAIIAPRTREEAQFVFHAFKKHDLEFSIRSGGHCFEPGSLSSGYIFDLRHFNEIIPDIENEEVYLGAGCRLQDVIEKLGEIDFAIPTGTCPTVGVTGLTLGGGVGLLTRTYGLTCDSVKKIILLNAKNEIIEVDRQNHPDLFWALKGGGNGSYGIVLGFVFKMHYIPIVSYFELLWKWEPVQAFEIIQAWMNWVKTLPDSITTSMRLEYKEGALGIKIIGIKVGNQPFTEWESAFGSLDPEVKIYQERYIETVKYWASQPSLPFNKIKSKILLDPLSKKVIRQVVEFLDELKHCKKPNLRVFLNFDSLGGRVKDFRSSFPFRNAFGWWYQAVYWPLQEQDAEAQAIINDIYHKTSSEVSKYSYANATDYELGERYLKAYYADNVNRLIRIKQKYDPHNLFRWKQSIPVSKCAAGK